MLIETLLNVIMAFLRLLFLPIQIENLPETVASTIQLFLVYMADGVAIVAAYTHFSYLLVLLGIVVVIDLVYTVYIVLMWIIKKIPFLGVQ